MGKNLYLQYMLDTNRRSEPPAIRLSENCRQNICCIVGVDSDSDNKFVVSVLVICLPRVAFSNSTVYVLATSSESCVDEIINSTRCSVMSRFQIQKSSTMISIRIMDSKAILSWLGMIPFPTVIWKIVQRSYCSVSYCKQSSISIQFPFWIQDQQPKDCGLSGFNIICNNQQSPVLDIPDSGRFIVSSIFYDRRKIMLKDPGNCLFNRLTNLNLTSSPFTPYYYETYTILSCPKGKAPVDKNVIHCLSNFTTDIVGAAYLIDELYTNCKKIMKLQVPSPQDSGFPVSLDLRWSPTTTSAPDSGSARVVRTVTLSLVVSVLVIPTLVACISICICIRKRDDSDTRTTDSLQNSRTIALSSSNEQDMTNSFDDSIVSSYKKITVGQSRRIEGPNDSTCAICLEDYAVNDTIMFMPECEHCFHVECIDKWLRMNSKCPICRNSKFH